MNRFQFLGSQKDEAGQEWCYIFDTQTGTTLKSPVKLMAGTKIETVNPQNAPMFTPLAGRSFPADTQPGPSNTPAPTKVIADPAGDMETPEQRAARLGKNKVPPAFLGNIGRMHLDPSKTDGRTDVTPFH